MRGVICWEVGSSLALPPEDETGDARPRPRPYFRGSPHMRQRRRRQRGPGRLLTVGVVIIAAAAIAGAVVLHNRSSDPTGPLPVQLPASTGSYLGVYTKGLPDSYAGVSAFKTATGSRPDVVMYYSGWFVPFPTKFATTVANEGAVPLVQMDPDNISLSQYRFWKVRWIPKRVRCSCPHLRAPSHRKLRPRDERKLVLVGLRKNIAHGVQSGLATHRQALPGI